ncbi:AbrB/MazE/SpoVT family DNA-binding domain-containing protein [Pelagibacterium xiamenense]|uniref:AbrB/MazE/SpoVT family DNA-binding domain-containing protein n=1 Tax=Pelagibacterium xiamenense TaxID=2901140 RepID=UPI001E2AF8A8|nr:AbrB/MazE/SpoVT family DNA-binding domain-containing protein [Pelagibacterium xiamenense]MCD7060459.1 AbrB/MazE/SpoVT family DNA-binding domain-containing protein [Pelagibacterium xiamenense]
MSTATLTSKGQMTLPKEVRDDLNLKPGDKIEFVKVHGHYELRARTRNIADFAGVLGEPPNGRRLSVKDMDDAIAEAVVEEYRRSSS